MLESKSDYPLPQVHPSSSWLSDLFQVLILISLKMIPNEFQELKVDYSI